MALMATHASLLGVHHSKAMLPWYHFDRVISPDLHGRLNVQPICNPWLWKEPNHPSTPCAEQ